MRTAKIAVSIDPKALRAVDRLVKSRYFPSRSRLVQDAVQEKLLRLRHVRLALESSKLNARQERVLADERLRAEPPWPEY